MPDTTQERITDFKLDPEQLDSLRLEVESATLAEKEKFNQLITEIHQRFLTRMSTHINEGDEIDIKNRFVLVDKESNKQFQSEWPDLRNQIVHSYGDDIGIMRTFGRDGKFVVGIRPDLWSDLPKTTQQRFITRCGSEENASQFVNLAYHTNIVMHEITHLYQPLDKEFIAPLWLLEAQAYWAGRELVDKNIKVNSSTYDKYADFYQKLLDKYGNQVHDICLSNSTDMSLLLQLNAEFTPEVQHQIFPEFKTKKME